MKQLIFVAVALAATSCDGGAVTPMSDGGRTVDAGVVRMVDAGDRDAASPPGADASSPGADASTPRVDSGTPPAGLRTGPYLHVLPADSGSNIGVGVVAAAPTETYGGSLTIRTPGTIEDVILDGCVRIESDGVVLRNVIVRCDSLYPVRVDGADDVTIEHSRIECTSRSKLFYVTDSQRFALRYSDISGCEDFFFIGGDVDGMDIAYNYMHHLNLSASSHADGFQIGEAAPTTGSIAIRGNWISADSDGGRTDILFATNQSSATVTVEDNYLSAWGLYTLRCGGQSTSCTAIHNVYDPVIASSDRSFYLGQSSGTHRFECNRIEGGALVPDARVIGASSITDGCPPWDSR